jgi:Tfp pilus assembly protein PilN
MFYTKTAIGVDWDGESLRCVALGRKLRGIAVIDSLELRNLHEDESRARVRDFLARNRLEEAWVTACLPRENLLLRLLDLPVEAEPQLKQVIAYQLEALHPSRDVSMSWDYAVLGRDVKLRQIQVLVVLAESGWLDRCEQALRDLGLRLKSLTAGAVSLSQLVGRALPDGAILVCGGENGLELIGLRSGKLSISRYVSAEPAESARERLERELHGISAAMPDLDPSARALFVCGAIPGPFSECLAGASPLPDLPIDFSTAPGYDIKARPLALGAAYAALKRIGAANINLLPLERRRAPKRWWLVPSSALAVTAVLLGLVVVGHRRIETALYNRALDQRIAQLGSRASRVQQIDQQAARVNAQAALLANLRDETWQKLRVLDGFSTLLPNDTWLQEVQLDGANAELYGYSDRAANLVQILENSPYVSGVEFAAPIVRGPQNKEAFRLRMRLGKAERR